MYDLIDRPVTDLDKGSRLLIWAMRSWAVAMAARKSPHAAITPALAHWHIAHAVAPFAALMAQFNRHALQPFLFAPLHCNRISEHEALVLAMVRDSSAPVPRPVDGVLSLLVAEPAVAPVAAALARLGAIMTTAGLVARGVEARPG